MDLSRSLSAILAWTPSAGIATAIAGVGRHVDAALYRVTIKRPGKLHRRVVAAAVLGLCREADVISADRSTDGKRSGSPRIGDRTRQIVAVLPE